MPTVITRKTHPYGGKTRHPRDEYEAAPRDLRILRALGWAREKPPEGSTPAPVVPITAAASTAKGKATYKSKPMKAKTPAVEQASAPAPSPFFIEPAAATPVAPAPKFDEPTQDAGYARRDLNAEGE